MFWADISCFTKIGSGSHCQTFQCPSHANLEVLKKSPEKPGDWDLKPGDFQNMRQIKKNNNRLFVWVFFYLFSAPCCILLMLFLLSSSGQQVAILKLILCMCSKVKLSQRPLRIDVSLAYCSLRNETKWKSAVCEMKICSLRNENL